MMGRSKAFNRLIMVSLIAVCLITFSGCIQKKPIEIGVVGTMTGSTSDLSVSGRRGIEMAVDEINKNGGVLGRSIALVIKDDMNNQAVAKRVDQAFLDEGINLIIGHYTSGMVLSVIDFINDNEVLMIGPTVSADSLTGKDDNFVRFISSTVEQAAILVDYIKEQNDQEFVVIFDERNAGFTDQFVDNFKMLFIKYLGNSPEIIAYNPAEQKSQNLTLEKIKALKPQGALILASAEDSAKIAQQLSIEGIKLHLYGPLWANTPELIKKGGLAVENMVVVGALDLNSTDEAFVRFKTHYFERYGDQPSFSSVYSYEAMYTLAESIKRANSIDPAAIKAKMLEVGEYDGVIGRIALNNFGDVKRKYMIFKVSDGQLRMVR